MKNRIILMTAGCILSFIPVLMAFGQGGHGRARLTGTVTDRAGNPIAAAKIQLTLAETTDAFGNTPFRKVERRDSGYFETTTDKKGRWTYNGLATGIWRITASAKGYFSSWRECSVFQLQQNKIVPLQLEKIPELPTENLPEPALLDKANDLFYLRNYDQAILYYQAYLIKDPEAVMVMLTIGDCYQEKGDLEKAIEQFHKIVDKTSKDPLDKVITARALARIGECHYKKGDLDQAQEFFRRSLENDPEDELIAYNLAEIYFSRQKTDEAIRFYSQAIQVAPSWSDPYYKLGHAYLNKADYEKAQEAFKKLLKLEPNSTRAAKVKKILEDLEKIRK
jgi:tetratricopeptide (TPR) repeat protein